MSDVEEPKYATKILADLLKSAKVETIQDLFDKLDDANTLVHFANALKVSAKDYSDKLGWYRVGAQEMDKFMNFLVNFNRTYGDKK